MYLYHNNIKQLNFNNTLYTVDRINTSFLFNYYRLLFIIKNLELYENYIAEINHFVDKYYGNSYKLEASTSIKTKKTESCLFTKKYSVNLFIGILNDDNPKINLHKLNKSLLVDEYITFKKIKDIKTCITFCPIQPIETNNTCKLNTNDITEFAISIIDDIISTKNIELTDKVLHDINKVIHNEFHLMYRKEFNDSKYNTKINGKLVNSDLLEPFNFNEFISTLDKNATDEEVGIALCEQISKIKCDEIFSHQLINENIMSRKEVLSMLYKQTFKGMYVEPSSWGSINRACINITETPIDTSSNTGTPIILNTDEYLLQDFLKLI